jgi:urease accessory protein UreF
MANFGSREAYAEWSDAEIDRLQDLFPCTPWPELLAALPRRSRSAIWQMGKNVLKLAREINPRPKWTTDEIIILRRVYPSVPDDELKATFPRHSFEAIQRKASELKIMRPRLEARNHGRFVHPIIAQLYEERKRQRLNRVQLAEKIGYTHGSILGWELGQTKPDFVMVCDWAQGLDFEIIARKRESPEAIVIAYPEKHRLMGSRA